MDKIVHSKMAFLNPDRNFVLGGLLRAFVYNQFCAGTNPAEVKKSIANIKAMGYDGVILGYGREIVLDNENKSKDLGSSDEAATSDPHIAAWLDGNLKTLDCIGAGDYMNVKYTGAGENVSKALVKHQPPPKQLVEALDAICQKAASQNSRIWIDAEQKVFQETIDDWTIDLMRKYNRGGKALVSNTIQAYLKDSRQNVLRHLQAAQAEGWSLGIKVVRGAYIQQDNREYIWDTKAETDENYNSIARDLLSRQNFGPGVNGETFPDVHLFLAGHNKNSIQLLTRHYQQLVCSGEQPNPIAFGQLQGMADEVGCELIQLRKGASQGKEATSDVLAVPRAYKCLNWGSIRECMHFLMRRAVENASSIERLNDGLGAIKTELKRRILPLYK